MHTSNIPTRWRRRGLSAQQLQFSWPRFLLLLAALCLHAPLTEAQILDDIELQSRDEGTAVIVHFAAQVSYRRHVVAVNTDEVQIYFAITAAGDVVAGTDDVRDVPGGGGLPRITVRLPAQAQTNALRRVDLRFESPVDIVRVGPGPDNRTLAVIVRSRVPIEAAAPAGATSSAPTSSAAPGAAPQTTPGATTPGAIATEPPAALLAQAKLALAEKRYEQAVALFNHLLDLPPNATSQEAQALIGDARAALGENERARTEYKLYLKLYPDSVAAADVQRKLAALSNAPSGRAAKASPAAAAERTTYWGSINQSYYGGQSQLRNETTIVTPATDATQIDVQNISSKDQSSLVTNLDANARYRGNGWDNRFVVRDVHVLSLISAQPTQNRLSALYADFKNDVVGFDARFGRQSSTSGGVLGRFDGAVGHFSIGRGIGKDWRVGVLGGRPVEKGIGKAKYFYGATLDNDHLIDGLGLGLFAIEQRTENVVDRRAVGTEIRYFTQAATAFSLLDYDIRYKQINVGSAQGTLVLGNGATINLLYDYRRSPTLQLTNALLGAPVSSIDRLRELQSTQQIERDAVALTPISKVALLGSTFPISQHWQLGTEARISSISGTDATINVPAAPASGNVYSYTLQAIGSAFGTSNGVVVFSGSRLMSDASNAWLVSMNTRFRATPNWSIEPTLRYFTQDASNDTQLERLSPTLRVTYQLRESIGLEAEVSFERSHTHGSLVDEQSNVLFYYIGYHWDF